jgi:hypothetical protein
MGGAVELARAALLAPADHRPHRPVGRHHHNGRLRCRAVLDLGLEDEGQRLLRRRLQPLVERGADDDVLGRGPGQEIRPLLHHPVGKGTPGIGRGRFRQLRGKLARLVGLRRVDIALLLHQADDHIGPVLAALQVAGRRIVGRRRQQPRKQRAFRGIDLVGALAEIALRRALEAAGPGAQIGAVEIDRQNLVLAELRLQRKGKGHFLDLAPQAARAAVGLVVGLALPDGRVIGHAKADQLRHLLRDRRAAVAVERPAPLAKVDPDGRGDAARRHAQVAVEPLVLRGDDGVAQVGRDARRIDMAAEGLAAPGKDLALAVEQRHRPPRPSVEQGVKLWQLRVEIPGRPRDDERQRHGTPPGDAPQDAPDKGQHARDPAKRPAAAPARRALAGGRLLRCGLRGLRRIAPVGHQPSFSVRCHLLSRPGSCAAGLYGRLPRRDGNGKPRAPRFLLRSILGQVAKKVQKTGRFSRTPTAIPAPSP